MAAFSHADPARLYAPYDHGSRLRYEAVNVEAQSRSRLRYCSATKKLISVRKSTLAFGRGSMTFVRPPTGPCLAYVREYKDEVILCVANLSARRRRPNSTLAVEGTYPARDARPHPLPAIGDDAYTDHAYTLRLLLVSTAGARASRATPERVPTEFLTLVCRPDSNWVSLTRTRAVRARRWLPGYLARSRWFPERDERKIGRVSSLRFHSATSVTSAVADVLRGDSRGVPARYRCRCRLSG